MYQGAAVRCLLGTARVIVPGHRVLSFMGYASKKIPPSDDSGKNKENKEIGHTTVIIQDRLDIQEVPTIVRKVKNSDIISENVTAKRTGSVRRKRDPKEEKEIIEGFSKCDNLQNLYDTLDALSSSELTPVVAVNAVKRIIELENNTIYRNQIRLIEKSGENVRRTLMLNKLLSVAIRASQSSLLFDGLKTMSRDTVGRSDADYKEKFFTKVLIYVNDKKFSLGQTCEVIKLLSLCDFHKKTEFIDNMWPGIMDRGREINETIIGEVFRVLPIFVQSRKMIFNMLERKMYDLWWRVHCNTIVEVMTALNEAKISSPRIQRMLARNTSTTVHTLSEDELLQIVTCFSASNYIDANVETVLEKYVKAKGFKVKNAMLITAILEYCAKFRFRNETILQVCADYLVRNYGNFSPSLFKSYFIPFGLLNYQPTNGMKFWQIVEHILDDKFVQYRPDDVIEIILSCVYLEKFPLNVTKKVLNPYFLDKLHSCRTGHELQDLRTKLKIFDSAMTLECAQYQGPMLPREYVVQSVVQDSRIKRIINELYDIVSDIAGGCERISTSVLLPQLPNADLYLIDILFHPVGMGLSMQNFDFTKDYGLYMALLIHLPEDYCLKGKCLLGPQAMKKRHFRKLGLNVIDLEYNEIVKLKGNPIDLQQYIVDKFEAVIKSLE